MLVRVCVSAGVKLLVGVTGGVAVPEGVPGGVELLEGVGAGSLDGASEAEGVPAGDGSATAAPPKMSAPVTGDAVGGPDFAAVAVEELDAPADCVSEGVGGTGVSVALGVTEGVGVSSPQAARTGGERERYGKMGAGGGGGHSRERSGHHGGLRLGADEHREQHAAGRVPATRPKWRTHPSRRDATARSARARPRLARPCQRSA